MNLLFTLFLIGAVVCLAIFVFKVVFIVLVYLVAGIIALIAWIVNSIRGTN